MAAPTAVQLRLLLSVGMRGHQLLVAAGVSAITMTVATSTFADDPVALSPVDTYETGLGEASAEIVALDGDRAFVINTASTAVDLVTVGSDGALDLVRRVDLAAYGSGGNSVAAHDGLVAVALDAETRTDPGTVVFLDREGDVLTTVSVGAVPDMVTFTPDGKHLLVANEGEPDDDYAVDPEGSVSVVNVRPIVARRGGQAGDAGAVVRTAGFEGVTIPDGVRIFGPGATPAQDLEPEYIAVAPDGRHAFVTLQENNAVAVLDVQHARFTALLPLGLKDHRLDANALDANDEDGAIGITSATVPLLGMYQPDAIAAFDHDGQTYLATANEGDVREWGDYEEGESAGDLAEDGLLDAGAFPGGLPADLEELTVSTASGDTDGDGDFDELHAFGARSFSIWTAEGDLVFDSGDQFEWLVADIAPEAFNVSNTNNEVDNRSDDKGPEPEGITIGEIDGRRVAFVALERVGGVLIYDLTNPSAPVFQSWANNRVYGVEDVTGDSGPEGLAFAPAHSSPTGAPLLLVGNEVSGTVTAYG